MSTHMPTSTLITVFRSICADVCSCLDQALSALGTHRCVDVPEDVELDHDGEDEEDAVAEEAGDAKASVEAPAAEMDGADLQT